MEQEVWRILHRPGNMVAVKWVEISGETSTEESIIQNEESKVEEVTEEGDGKNSSSK